jgi:membrane fusion protein (multidrug efflux system)
MEKRFLLLSLLVPATLLLLVSCGGEGPAGGGAGAPPAAAVQVSTAQVELRPFTDTTLSVGNLRATESVEISASVTEKIVSLEFEDGQTVKKGDVIARLESDEETALMDIARAELAEEQREIERIEGLVRTNAVAEVTLEERRTQAVRAEGAISRIEAMVKDRLITAPFDGVLGLRRISAGALVAPGTIITTLDKIDTMKLDFTVPEVFLGTLTTGTTLTARTMAYPDNDFTGSIETIDTRVDPVTRSVPVRAILQNPDKKLKPGMLMTVELQRNERSSPTIPERALVPLGERQAVYLVTPEGTAKRVEVILGTRIPGYVEIASGLSTGDTIVVDGVLSLRDGAAVKVTGEYAPPSAPFDPTSSAPVK